MTDRRTGAALAPGRTGASISISAAILLICLGVQSVNAGSETLFQRLSGDWSGWGWIEFASGDRERIRCRVSYRLRGSGNRLSQKLRCASTSFNIDGSADLKNDNGRISGQWREKTYNSEGRVSGQATSNYMSVRLTGDTLDTGMSVSTAGACRQSIGIRPNDADIKKITVNMKRC